MKVTEIKPSSYKDIKGNTVWNWWVSFEGDARRLLCKTAPTFQVGGDISIESLETKLNKKQEPFFILADKPAPSGATPTEKPSVSAHNKDEDIFLSVAFKGAVESACAHNLPSVEEILKRTNLFYYGLLKLRGSVEVVKK